MQFVSKNVNICFAKMKNLFVVQLTALQIDFEQNTRYEHTRKNQVYRPVCLKPYQFIFTQFKVNLGQKDLHLQFKYVRFLPDAEFARLISPPMFRQFDGFSSKPDKDNRELIQQML